MIPRYTRPEMAAIWAPETRFTIWLEIETQACEAQEKLGIIPPGVAAALRARGRFEVARIDEIEDELKHQNPEWKERLAEWEETVSETQSNWQSVIPLEEDRTTGGQKYKLGPDDSLLAQGYAPTRFDAT